VWEFIALKSKMTINLAKFTKSNFCKIKTMKYNSNMMMNSLRFLSNK